MLYSNTLSLWLQSKNFNQASFYKSPAHSSTGTRANFSSEGSLLRSFLYCLILPLLVSLWFHGLFHSPDEVLFTFPSRYCFAIGHPRVFSLTRWSSQIHTGFHVPHATRESYLKTKSTLTSLTLAEGHTVLRSIKYSITGLSPSLVQDSAVSFIFTFGYLHSYDSRPTRWKYRIVLFVVCPTTLL